MNTPYLHVITDESLQERFRHQDLAQLCSAAGADFIQWREKRNVAAIALYDTAYEMAGICEATRHTELIINDHIFMVMDIQPRGVHLGANDMDLASARKFLGPRFLIGGTVNSLEEAKVKTRSPADYLGVGPVFSTKSKADAASALGLDTLSEIVRVCSLPVIAIGNIQLGNVERVLDSGVAGIAVLSDIVLDKDPARKTAQYKRILESR